MKNTSPIVFPSALSAQDCAARLHYEWPHARAAIRKIDGHSRHVVLLVGERMMTR